MVFSNILETNKDIRALTLQMY